MFMVRCSVGCGAFFLQGVNAKQPAPGFAICETVNGVRSPWGSASRVHTGAAVAAYWGIRTLLDLLITSPSLI